MPVTREIQLASINRELILELAKAHGFLQDIAMDETLPQTVRDSALESLPQHLRISKDQTT